MANEILTSGGIQVGWGSQWETLANAINDYYGGGVQGAQYQQVVTMLNSGEYTMAEMENILGQIPEFTRTYNSAGQLTGVSYNVASNSAASAAGTVAQQVNSNVANATQTQFSTVQTITKDAETGAVAVSDNLIKYKTGQLAPTTAKGIPISVLQGVMAASAGITIGKNVSQLAYDNGWNYLEFAGVEMEMLNPQTWASITEGDDSLGAKAFNMILGLDEDNNPQLYATESALAYMVGYMGATGVFGGGGVTPPADTSPQFHPNEPYYDEIVVGGSTFNVERNGNIYTVSATGGAVSLSFYDTLNVGNRVSLAFISENPFTYSGAVSGSSTQVTHNGYTYYVAFATVFQNTLYPSIPLDSSNQVDGVHTPSQVNILYSDILFDYAYRYFNGTSQGGVEGITDQTGATQFNTSGISDWSDIAAILAALKLQYPNLWDERIEVSPDGDNVITYIPVGFPTGGTGQQPTTDGAKQSELTPDITGDGDNSTDELIKTLIDAITHPQDKTGMESNTDTPTKPVDPNGDPRGTGETPVIVIPTGSASALWKIYNPSQAQLDTFGAWLWSSNFVDQLLKLFNDPMQAIIGLHKIYATPPTSGSGAIKVGYLTSDASANYVSAQYTEIDCGTVNLKEYFNNVFDYDPFTKVSIFLPFIGFRQLNVSDVMRGDISVKYGVDVLTGACLAKISVKRDLNDNILYTFAGNCAVQYPVSSGSYVGIVTGLLGIAGGIAGTIASGGALAPMLMGAGASVGAMHANVEHSGNISANAGAMGSKKPYIVIERPQTKIPLYGVEIEGKPQNETVVLGSLTGHVRVKAAEFNGFSCTAGELVKIKQLLTSGIII